VKIFVGHGFSRDVSGLEKIGFTGCGKIRFWCHSERSEESLFDLSPMHREILRFAQNDKRTFSAASLAAGDWEYGCHGEATHARVGCPPEGGRYMD
jgi:hypothetical protein